MRLSASAFALMISLLALSACASPDAATLNRNHLQAQLREVEETAAALRAEHTRMGQTLTTLEAKANQLTAALATAKPPATQAEPVKLVAAAPATPILEQRTLAAKPIEESAAPKPRLVKLSTPPKAAAAAPVRKPAPLPTKASTPKAQVSSLSADDFDLSPTTPKTTEKPTATATPRSNKNQIVLHLASYTQLGQLASGWREVKAHSPALARLQPARVEFVDGKGQKWQRLVATGFASHAEAQKLCASLQSSHTWCEVLTPAAASVKTIR